MAIFIFRLRRQQAVPASISCAFSDIINTDLVEYEYCSNRGICEFRNGTCSCFDGYTGVACQNMIPDGSDAGLPGLPIYVPGTDYKSTAVQIHAAQTKSSNFNFVTASANGDVVFQVCIKKLHSILLYSTEQCTDEYCTALD